VNNESSEIIRMFYNGFDSLLPQERREETKGDAGLFPAHLRSEIEEMNDWVYNTINNGVYKSGFASTQEAYESNVFALFKSLDRLEEHLADSAHQPYLFGSSITEADIRLYTTMVRFDPAYHPIFKCNIKMIRYDYPRLHQWLRNLYWKGPEVFQKSVKFEAVSTSLHNDARLTFQSTKKVTRGL
jgi:glutathionyl-hydroquinone reductase